jgi:SHS2 domain-containing protein
MNALTGGQPESLSVDREIILQAPDLETLLVTWLEELAFLMETSGEVFDRFEPLSFSPTELRVKVQGGPAAQLDKLIKAITFHNLSIQKTAAGFEATIVFDV